MKDVSQNQSKDEEVLIWSNEQDQNNDVKLSGNSN